MASAWLDFSLWLFQALHARALRLLADHAATQEQVDMQAFKA